MFPYARKRFYRWTRHLISELQNLVQLQVMQSQFVSSIFGIAHRSGEFQVLDFLHRWQQWARDRVAIQRSTRRLERGYFDEWFNKTPSLSLGFQEFLSRTGLDDDATRRAAPRRRGNLIAPPSLLIQTALFGSCQRSRAFAAQWIQSIRKDGHEIFYLDSKFWCLFRHILNFKG